MSLIQALRDSMRRKRQRRASVAIDRVAVVARHIDLLLTQAHLRHVVQQARQRNPLLAFGHKVFSQNDEDGILEEICRRTGLTGAGSFLELGIGDGTENNSLNLLLKGWRGVWLGGEPLGVKPEAERLVFERCWIDKDNVVGLARAALGALEITQPDFVSVDLDGNDYYITEALLQAGFQPAIWATEYNARFSPATHWVMPYDAAHQWDGTDHFGASLAAYDALFRHHGYRCVGCNVNGVNAFFVSMRHDAAFRDIPADCASLFMPADLHGYPHTGARPGPKVIEAALKGAGVPRPPK